MTQLTIDEKELMEKFINEDYCVCPRGIRDLMLYFKKEYNIPSIYITESGNNTSLYIFSFLDAFCPKLQVTFHVFVHIQIVG